MDNGIDAAMVNIDDLDVKQEQTEEEVIRPESFDNARLKDETWEAYKTRRVQIKNFMSRKTFHENLGETNRAQRRKRKVLRMTKPLRQVRKKWFVGSVDVTYAIKTGISLPHFIRVMKLGYTINDLKGLGKEMEEQNELRKEE